MTFCGNCGSDNPAGNRFCFNCGAEITSPPPQPEFGFNQGPAEIERIGAYDPNVNYPAPPMPGQAPQYQQQPYGYQQQPYQDQAQQYQQQAYGYQQPYQQIPGQPQQPYQEGQQYQQLQYQQQYPGQQPYGYQQPYQQPYQQQYQQQRQLTYLYGAPNNASSARMASIAMAIVTLAMTIITLVAIPVNWSDFGTTLIGIGMNHGAVLAFAIVSLVIGVIGLMVPLFSVVSGVCIIATAFLAKDLPNSIFTNETLIIYVALAVIVMILGLIASMLMMKYVRFNVRGVNMFQCCLFTWKGIPMPPGYSQGYQQQQQYKY
jgi:hypothetical protein